LYACQNASLRAISIYRLMGGHTLKIPWFRGEKPLFPELAALSINPSKTRENPCFFLDLKASNKIFLNITLKRGRHWKRKA
jgi:hypothetical protein